MNRSIGSAIAPENVTKDAVLWVKTRTLGSCLIRVLKDLKTEGWSVQILEGSLRGPATGKTWKKGDTVTLSVSSVDRFYELADGAA